MPKSRLSLTALTILSCATLTGRAGATPSAVPSSLPAPAALVREAAILCGGNGCAPVQTKQVQRKKFHPLGYTKPI